MLWQWLDLRIGRLIHFQQVADLRYQYCGIDTAIEPLMCPKVVEKLFIVAQITVSSLPEEHERIS